MSKRKPMDKAQARERRDQLLASAAAANLSLTEGVREMRAIAGMTQEEFARHREVSARVIKAIELGQGNPTVATLNRIGQFFGLEVGFVPVKRGQAAVVTADTPASPPAAAMDAWTASKFSSEVFREVENFLVSEAFQQVLEEGIRAGLRDAAGILDSSMPQADVVSLEKQVQEETARASGRKEISSGRKRKARPA